MLLTEQSRVCRKCETDKPLDAFRLQRAGKNGKLYRQHTCLACEKNRRGARYAAHSEEERARNTSPEGKARLREYHLQRTYGISVTEYATLVRKQKSRCASCGKKCRSAATVNEGRGSKSDVLRVDHCHASGKVRGLLCHQCNVVLGLVSDDPVRLKRLVEYLEDAG